MSELTKAQIKSYVSQSGTICPYCNSNYIEGQSVQIDDNGAYQVVICNNCDKSWTDQYTLTNMVENNE